MTTTGGLGSSARIHGIDVARGLAMLGMVVVHYVWADGVSGSGPDVGAGAELARAMEGRAMPLFMLLGGIGVVLVAQRSADPDRGLVIRAVLLFGLGLVLDATSERIAIVLQLYGLLFLVAPLLRRLPVAAGLGGAAAATAVGAWTYQVVGSPRGLRSLLFDGYYPFFPVAAFFLLGMVVARLDLRSGRVAAGLATVGTVVGLGAWVAAEAVATTLGVDPEALAAGPDAEAGRFVPERLLDVSGHSAMPAWVISAAGTSVAVLGLSLLAADRFSRLVRPLALVGTMALSFYVFQALATNVYPPPSETDLVREWLTVAELYLGFLAVALVWRHWFRRGPMEALLRVGSR